MSVWRMLILFTLVETAVKKDLNLLKEKDDRDGAGAWAWVLLIVSLFCVLLHNLVLCTIFFKFKYCVMQVQIPIPALERVPGAPNLRSSTEYCLVASRVSPSGSISPVLLTWAA